MITTQKIDMSQYIKKAGLEGTFDLDIDLGHGLKIKCKLEILPACPIRDSMLFQSERGYDAEETKEDKEYQEVNDTLEQQMNLERERSQSALDDQNNMIKNLE